MRYILPLLLVACSASLAHAKKSKFRVHNCTGENFRVMVYNGDDNENTSPKKTQIVRPGETQKLRCKVSSGKKRCKYRIKDEAKKASSVNRVKDGRTLYVTKISLNRRWDGDAGGGWGGNSTDNHTSFQYNTESCTAN